MTQIQQKLFDLADPAYRDFSAALMPNVDKNKVIGVRIPALRALAKQLWGTPAAEEFLHSLPHRYYEENNLHAFLLEKITHREQLLTAIEAFLPWVDNWATCDSFSPRLFQKQPPEIIWLDSLLQSEHPFAVRFGMLCLMRYYLEDRFDESLPRRIAAVQREEYYIQMMQAWYFATALAKQWDKVLPWLRERRLHPWVHRKAIQKALESRRITPAQKTCLKTLK